MRARARAEYVISLGLFSGFRSMNFVEFIYGHVINGGVSAFDYSDSSVAAAGTALSDCRGLLHERWYLPIFRDCR